MTPTKFSLTQALIASDIEAFKAATQSPFLARAAKGQVPKAVLEKWLANDRLYIHGYIRGVGRLLSFLQLPETSDPSAASAQGKAANRQLLDWMIDALVSIRREEDFFVKTAAQYGLNINLGQSPDGTVPPSAKLEGLRRFETLFDALGPGESDCLPWLESAVIFWGTEKCYLEAWSGVRAQLDEQQDGGGDADGGALRREFIPNWSSGEFAAVVDQLGGIIDAAVAQTAERREEAKEELLNRALTRWGDLLAAEKAFWPAMDPYEYS